ARRRGRARRRGVSHPHAAGAHGAGHLAGRRRANAQSRDELASLPSVIAHLRGTILEKHPNRVVVDVGGVGYDVAVPLSTFYGLGDAGQDVALRVHTHVREDAIALFGFASPLELDLFERLIGISGIGPKLGLAVLSGIEPQELIGANHRGDLTRLTAIPGVGKKTSERIVLELKDRLPKVQTVPAAPDAGVVPVLRDDLL